MSIRLVSKKNEYGDIDFQSNLVGISALGLGLAFVTISFKSIRDIASVIAVAWTTYKMINELEQKGKINHVLPKF